MRSKEAELLIEGDEGEPTAEEYEAVSLLWKKGELLPFPWIVVELPTGPTTTGLIIPPGTKVMLKSPAVWAKEYAEDMNLDPSQPDMKPAREMTDEDLLQALRADLRRPFREVRPTHLRRLRERAEGVAEVVQAKAVRRARRLSRVWTEKRPGQLLAIRNRLKGGDASRLSDQARRMLVLIARRPDVTISRRWTTAKASRVSVNADALRAHFHRWAASVARNAATFKQRQAAEVAAAEIRRQDQLAYKSLAAAQERDEREQERIFEFQEAARAEAQLQARAALARLVDRGAALREDARLEALEARELNDVPEGPWVALDDVPTLRVLDGGRVGE